MRFHRLAAAITLITFTSTQLSGCLTIPEMPQSLNGLASSAAKSLSTTEASAPMKGSFTPTQQALAQEAQALFKKLQSGKAKLGYSTIEYRERLQRLQAAKAAIQAAPNSYSMAQFTELADALTRMLVYVDAIESIDQLPASAYAKNASISPQNYQIDPGERATFDIKGYCLDHSVYAPSRGVPLQLLSVNEVWPEELRPVFQRIIAQHKPNPASSRLFDNSNADIQAAIWFLQELRDGNLTSEKFGTLSSKQIGMLREAGVTPQMLLDGTKRMLMNSARANITALTNEVSSLAAGVRSLASAGQVMQIAMNGQSGLLGGLGIPAGQAAGASQPQTATAASILGNNALLNNNRALTGALQDWLKQGEKQPQTKSYAPETGYTLLAQDVAARAVATAPLTASIEVANLSPFPYTFTPTSFVLNARTETQPIGLSQWQQTAAADAAQVVKSPEDNELREALFKDLRAMALDKAFKAFTTPNSAALSALSSQFRSRAAQNLISSMPVVGNIVSLGLLISGKNLDGTDMESWDYVGAALGMVPVAGNVARGLGAAGTSILRRELERAAAVSVNPNLHTAVSVMGSDTLEYAMENTPVWLREQYSFISREAIAKLPETSAFTSSAGARLSL